MDHDLTAIRNAIAASFNCELPIVRIQPMGDGRFTVDVGSGASHEAATNAKQGYMFVADRSEAGAWSVTLIRNWIA